MSDSASTSTTRHLGDAEESPIPGNENWADGFNAPDMNGLPSAVAVDDEGNIYVGGAFETIGDQVFNHIAMWNGESWLPLGSGIDGWVSSLVFTEDGDLYAAGDFRTAGGVAAYEVARWDGTAWRDMAGASGTAEFAYGRALALDRDGGLLAVCSCDVGGAGWTERVASWDGVNWSAVGSRSGNGVSGAIRALYAGHDGYLYAGGSDFSLAGGVRVGNIARWDGMNWSALGEGVDRGRVLTMTMDGDGNVYAGGWFEEIGGKSIAHVARWDGEQWHALGSGMNGGVLALIVDEAGDLYAGGWFETAGGKSANRIARWDGEQWHALGNGADFVVQALAFGASGELVAGGFESGDGDIPLARWDGTSWSKPYGSFGGNEITSLVVDRHGDLYAAGNFWMIGGLETYNIARWDGASWSNLAEGLGDSYADVTSLVLDDAGNMVASGRFSFLPHEGNLALWDGEHWLSLGQGLGGARDMDVFSALAIDGNGRLFVGADFVFAGGKPSSSIAQWTAADGGCELETGSYTFYVDNMPVNIDITTLGTLDCLTVQRHDRSHPHATPALTTGYYWAITGEDRSGNPASGFELDLTLPTMFTPTGDDQLCMRSGDIWDCADDSFEENAITRSGVTKLGVWAVADQGRVGLYLPAIYR